MQLHSTLARFIRKPPCRRTYEAAIIIAFFLLFAFLPSLPSLPLCPFRWLGHSCPTCGTTRAVWAITHGEFALCWRYNPVGFIVVLALVRRLLSLGDAYLPWTTHLDHQLFDVTLVVSFFLLGHVRFLGIL